MSPRKRLLLIFAGIVLLTVCVDQWRRTHLEHSQDKNIMAAARHYGVDPALVKAVIWRESRFDPGARGRKGEIGLMQIMPAGAGNEWASAQHISNFADFMLRDPQRNVDCGTWYLRKLLARYQNTDNPVPYALADYNAGRANALKWMTGAATTNSTIFVEQIGYPSTRLYVRAIMRRKARYDSWARDQLRS
jgi:soluble lytic murein transglycosylase